MKQYHERVSACGSVQEAADQALAKAEKDDVIVAFGSLSFLCLLS